MERRIKFGKSKSIKLWHLFYYLPRKSAWDNNAQLILDFKNNSKSAAEYLLDCSLRELRGYNLAEEIFVIRVLKSSETRALSGKGNVMDWLGQGIAMGIGGIYLPQLLVKKKVTKQMKHLPLHQREEELRGVYAVRELGLNFNNRNILLLDDIVTTGTTARAIVMAIFQVYPRARVNIFALGLTPSRQQRRWLFEQQSKGMLLNEPRPSYGNNSDLGTDGDTDWGENL